MNKCTLGCFIKNTDQGYAFGNVEDGTNCDDDTEDKCVNGECVVSLCRPFLSALCDSFLQVSLLKARRGKSLTKFQSNYRILAATM